MKTIQNKNIKLKLFANLLFLLLITIMVGCKKDKLESIVDHRVKQELLSPSHLRLINLTQYKHVVVGKDTLTNLGLPSIVGPGVEGAVAYPPTTYFPENGVLGTTWNIPQIFLNASASTKIILRDWTETGIGSYEMGGQLEVDVKEQGQQAKDYYVWTSHRYVEENVAPQPKVLEVKRDENGPTREGYIKIRVINLAAKIISSGAGIATNAEDILDSYTLSYVDGSAVHPKLSNVAQGEVSEYVELPYGYYQFRMLAQDKRQLAYGNYSKDESIIATDPATSTIGQSEGVGSGQTFNPIQSFNPGGVYTIVVAPMLLEYHGSGGTVGYYQNAYQIIRDNEPAVNRALAKMQVVNTLVNYDNISVRVNDKVFAEVGYAQASDQRISKVGVHKVEIFDTKNTLLTSQEIKLIGNDNVTIWVNQDRTGKIIASVAYNNLTGVRHLGNADDNADYSRFKFSFPFELRFFNFAPEYNYLTFTRDEGQNLAGNLEANVRAFQNLQPGQVVNMNPMTYPVMYNNMGFNIYCYQSTPEVVPGDRLLTIQKLNTEDLITNKALYDVRGKLPSYEAGIYSIAIIGNSKAATDAKKPRFFVLKHHQ
ncbi:hypothetical protein [Sphingobacterium lactis]|uniref:DUF4397 domain-containing protein n=1 Tax=Sphingobacterium lactis TaxID=797291 RepID=A0A1H6BXE5_9SPHI|nr:hypothetical protein [Sphingobacterium lactis]SEG65323.1 hypothetical protein SAMN05421877_11236 [Sphingobacterium lactis]